MSTKQAPAAPSATRFVSPALNTIICGDAAQELRAIPDGFIDCIVTSPPYFRQRDYDVQGQVGTEKTPAEYVQRLMAILAECRRVLKPTGTMWLNIGDKYDGGRLLGIPWRVAIAMQGRRLDPSVRHHLAQDQRHAASDKVPPHHRP